MYEIDLADDEPKGTVITEDAFGKTREYRFKLVETHAFDDGALLAGSRVDVDDPTLPSLEVKDAIRERLRDAGYEVHEG